MSSRSALAVAFVFSSVVLAQQYQQAKCTDTAWSWATNSLEQDPCTVAAGLAAPCSPNGNYTVPQLPVGYFYSGPWVDQITTCLCNTVYYSLLSVCGQCQDGFAATWGTWNTNCTVVYTTYPGTLPEGYAVPDWAYQPLLNNGTVNFAAAKNDNNAESVGPPSPTFTTSNSIGTPSRETSTFTTSNSIGTSSRETSSTSVSGGSGTNAGAIAGGVVGGVIGLALIAVLVWFLRWRSNPKQNELSPAMFTAPQMGRNTSMVSQKPYDPNDPSTFPIAPELPRSPASPNFSPSVSPGPPNYAVPYQPNSGYQWSGQAPPQHVQFQGAPLPQV